MDFFLGVQLHFTIDQGSFSEKQMFCTTSCVSRKIVSILTIFSSLVLQRFLHFYSPRSYGSHPSIASPSFSSARFSIRDT